MPASAEIKSPPHQPLASPRGFPCPVCGSLVEPGDKFCHGCGATQAVPTAGAPPVEQQRFRCKNCGAETAVDPGQRSFRCPFCDSTYVMELPAAESNRERPEFVIGFAVTPEQAAEKFRLWLRQGGLFRPGDLWMAQVKEKLRGVYLPFWSFSMLAHSRWSAQIGEYWYRTETYTTTEDGKTVTRTREVRETEWWDLSGEHHNYYSGYLVSGSKGLPQGEAERIKPYHLPALKRYEPKYLAGWASEEYSVEKPAAQEVCKNEFFRWEQAGIDRFLPGDEHRGTGVKTVFSEINSDLILLPVYLLSYRYQEKVYRFLVNGQTGHMAGDKPLSPWRIGFAVALGVLLILLLRLLMRLKSH